MGKRITIDKKELIRLRELGTPNKEIAKKLNVKIWTIEKRIEEWGLQKNPVIPIDKEELQRLREENLSLKELAKHFNCSVDVISARVKEYNLPGKREKADFCYETMRKMVAQHKTNVEIAKFFNTNENQVREFRKEKDLYRTSVDPKDKILFNIQKTDSGCWEWEKSKNVHGYGTTHFNGSAWLSHRLSYTLFVEEIPKGLYILHKCHNRACCNPDHLYAGTQEENVRDAMERGTFFHIGDYSSSLSNKELIRYVKRLQKDGWSMKEIASYIDIHLSTAYKWTKK